MGKASAGLLLLLGAGMAGGAEARESEVRLEISARSPAFEGRSFGDHGAYEQIKAVAHMRIDPADPANRDIVDLDRAPRAADGMVDYDVDVVILRPTASQRASRTLVYDVVNRGTKLLGALNKGPLSGDPIAEGDGFLMRQGYTIMWSGWQSDARPAMVPPGMALPQLLGARFPIARQQDGSPITGRVTSETIFDAPTGDIMPLPYPAAQLSQSDAVLTVRQRSSDTARTLAPGDWTFVDAQRVRIKRPADMDAGAIYTFSYVARDPVVMGLGFAATRDLVAWLRRPQAGNPLADGTQPSAEKGRAKADLFTSAIAIGGSQSGRYLRDFLWQGFNRDTAGKRVFDGMIPYIAGARRTFTNFRFAEPGRFSRQHEDHDVPGYDFPFTYGTLTDPVTQRSDGLLARCTATRSCPRIFHVDTGAEFWQAGASLVGTGGTDRDVPLPDGVRAYALAGGTHAAGFAPPYCTYPANPLSYTPLLRALLVSMEDWTTGRAEPPQSRWPSRDAGQVVPVEEIEPPFKPWAHVVNRPVVPGGKAGWPVFVSAIGKDGNELAGLRMPELLAPTGSYLGWNVRKRGYAEGELCMIFGGYVPFAANAAARAPDDRRPALDAVTGSVQERSEAYAAATRELVRDRLLLAEDADAMIAAAAAAPAPAP